MLKKIFILFICGVSHFYLIQATPLFLDSINCTSFNANNTANFVTVNQGSINAPYLLVADPAYDQTFKKIFSWDNEVDGVSGAGRIMSLLNSIYYPDVTEYGFKIRDVSPLPNESTRVGENNQLGVLKFDVVYKCTCWEEGKPHVKEVYDIEMQTTYDIRFGERLFDYGRTLRAENSYLHTKVLAFLNYQSNSDNSSQLKLVKCNLATGAPLHEGGILEEVPGVVDTYCIDLYRMALALNSNEKILIGGKEIRTVGREWLKLLSMRHWATKYGNRYIVPNDGGTDFAIKSALTILSSVNEPDLTRYMLQDDSARGMLQGAFQNGFQDGALEQTMRIAKILIMKGKDDKEIEEITMLNAEQIQNLRKNMRL